MAAGAPSRGSDQDTDFDFESEAPTPGEGEVLVRNTMLSCDPTQRGWIAFDGIVMSGRAPADQGLFFGVALVASAVMSSAFFCGE
jgi:NADPH-dependent curcumin reductase CurA